MTAKKYHHDQKDNKDPKVSKSTHKEKYSPVNIESFVSDSNGVSQKNILIPVIGRGLFRKLKIVYLLFLFLLLIVAAYHIYFSNKLIPGVYTAQLNLGGLTYQQAVNKLSAQEKTSNKQIKVVYKDKEYILHANDIDLVYDWEATVIRAFELGRTKNFVVDSKDKIKGLVSKIYLADYYDYDTDKLHNFLLTVKGDLNSPAKDASFVINGNKLDIAQETSGQLVETEKLYKEIVNSFDDFYFDTKKVVLKPSNPSVTAAQLERVKDKAQKIVFSPITLKYKDQKWELNPAQKLEFLSIDPEDSSLSLDKTSFKTFLESLASSVDELPRGKVTSTDGDRVTGFEVTQDGVELDQDATTTAFKDAYLNVSNEVDIKVKTISGANVSAKDYGIFALLGEGKSKYAGSIPGRIHNLTLAAEKTNGVLVPPGVTYSFNKTIGKIDAAHGYDSAYIISNGRTVLGEGGGVCQTSTTLFRAVLNAGLPVITRHPHAYRVHYYEEESPIGIDASVFQPTLDFQFKNDTPNYILVQSSSDIPNVSLNFKIYGTPDGRVTEITEPIILSQSPAPAPLYQDDPTLAKGVVRQIDFAAGGASVSFTRTVKREGKVLINDVFKTNYQPWRAIFLVGTKK